MQKLKLVVILLLLLAPVLTARALDNSDCFACHNDKELVKTNSAGKAVSLFVDEKKFADSIHAKNLCTSCHSDITDYRTLRHTSRWLAASVTESKPTSISRVTTGKRFTKALRKRLRVGTVTAARTNC